MQNRVFGTLIAAAAIAAAGFAPAGSVRAVPQGRRGEDGGGQPHQGTAGMGSGTKVRGNRKVQRAAIKAKNRARHRRACRGRA